MGMPDDDEWARAATVGLEGLRVCKGGGVESGAGDATTLDVQLPGIAKLSDPPPKTASPPAGSENEEVIDPVLLSVLEQQRERLNVLKFEDKIIRFMKQTGEKRLEFPSLTSYHRLLVHRIAERFCMLHQSQPCSRQDTDDVSLGGVGGGDTGSLVLLKTPDSRLPRTFLIDIVNPAIPSSKGGTGGAQSVTVTRVSPLSTPSSTASGSKKVLLMRRDPKGLRASPDAASSQRKESIQVSVAEKEKAYAEARARIFGGSDVTSMPSEGGDSVESDSFHSSRIGSNTTLGLERGDVAMTGPKDGAAVKRETLGGGNYCQSQGPNGTNGFGVGRGRSSKSEVPSQGMATTTTTTSRGVEKSIEKPAKEATVRSSSPIVQNLGRRGKEMERRIESPSNHLPSAAAPKAVDAGEWLRDGKVRARRRDDGMELDPDFRRGYDVYRPCYAPYRDVKEPGMSGAGTSLLLAPHAASSELYEQPPYVGGAGLGRGVVDFGPPPQQRASGYPPTYPSPPMGQYGFDREYSGGYGGDVGLRMLHTPDHQVRNVVNVSHHLFIVCVCVYIYI